MRSKMHCVTTKSHRWESGLHNGVVVLPSFPFLDRVRKGSIDYSNYYLLLLVF